MSRPDYLDRVLTDKEVLFRIGIPTLVLTFICVWLANMAVPDAAKCPDGTFGIGEADSWMSRDLATSYNVKNVGGLPDNKALAQYDVYTAKQSLVGSVPGEAVIDGDAITMQIPGKKFPKPHVRFFQTDNKILCMEVKR